MQNERRFRSQMEDFAQNRSFKRKKCEDSSLKNLIQDLDTFDPYELKRKQIKSINLSDEMNVAMLLENTSVILSGKIPHHLQNPSNLLFKESERILQVFLKYQDRMELGTVRHFTLSEIKSLFYHHFPEARKLISLRGDCRNDCQVFFLLQKDPKHIYRLLEDEDVNEVSHNDIIEISYVL
jgi:hypothetical protein